jgi:hypothetical protein
LTFFFFSFFLFLCGWVRVFCCVRVFLLCARESNGPRECDAAKLTVAAAEARMPVPTVGDAYFFYPQRWAPLVLAYGAAMLGRGGFSWLQAHCK